LKLRGEASFDPFQGLIKTKKDFQESYDGFREEIEKKREREREREGVSKIIIISLVDLPPPPVDRDLPKLRNCDPTQSPEK